MLKDYKVACPEVRIARELYMEIEPKQFYLVFQCMLLLYIAAKNPPTYFMQDLLLPPIEMLKLQKNETWFNQITLKNKNLSLMNHMNVYQG